MLQYKPTEPVILSAIHIIEMMLNSSSVSFSRHTHRLTSTHHLLILPSSPLVCEQGSKWTLAKCQNASKNWIWQVNGMYFLTSWLVTLLGTATLLDLIELSNVSLTFFPQWNMYRYSLFRIPCFFLSFPKLHAATLKWKMLYIYSFRRNCKKYLRPVHLLWQVKWQKFILDTLWVCMNVWMITFRTCQLWEPFVWTPQTDGNLTASGSIVEQCCAILCCLSAMDHRTSQIYWYLFWAPVMTWLIV